MLRGKNLGIDSSVIAANASLRALVHRNTEEQYWDYVKRLAAESGIDPEDPAAVRKFDRHRPGKGSNAEWPNPHDPDAKIGRTKDGATDMIYKPETVVDLATGAVVQADVHPGDQADHKEVATRVLEAQQTIKQACAQPLATLTVTSVTSDKGYSAVDQLEPPPQGAVRAARRSVKSKSGKALLRRRGMQIERSFAHILDCGGMRRTPLRGWENLNKRFKLAAACYNLSQLMRKLFGFGTPKQLAAASRSRGPGLFWRVAAVSVQLTAVVDEITLSWRCAWSEFSKFLPFYRNANWPENRVVSTGC